MRSYKCLDKQIFCLDDFQLIPIRDEDRFLIMKWRNEQIYHLRQAKPLTEEDQENYFRNTVSKLFEEDRPSQLLFSFLKDGVLIGYGGLVHINWIDQNAEISFIMDTSLEKEYFEVIWQNYLKLLEEIAFDELKLHKIYTYAFDLRPHLYEALEQVGYSKSAILAEHCFFNGKYIDVVIHSKINRRIDIRRIVFEDMDLIYNWSNDTITRQNSFNSEPIIYENHVEWFKRKIKENVAYFILEVDNNPAGLVRFDEEKRNHVIGILIDKEFRGKKLAADFLTIACSKFQDECNSNIFAYIKNENIASIKSFEKAGFKLIEETEINHHKALKFKYENSRAK